MIDLVIAGQMPPPYGGQNLNIQRLHRLFSARKGYRTRHLAFEFTKHWGQARKVDIHRIFEVFCVVGRLLRLRMEGKIDVLLYPVGGPHRAPAFRDILLLPWMRLLSRRVILHFRAAGAAEFLERQPEVFACLLRWVYAHCAGEALVLTEYGKRDALAAGVGRLTVIPNAYEDLARAVVIRNNKDHPVFLHVGHLCKDKGTLQLIQAFRKIVEMEPKAELHLAGEPLAPCTEEDIRNTIKESDLIANVRLLGILHGKDLENVYREADLFVFSSVAPYESFGMVLIEAMQWSLPLVVTDWRGNLSVCGDGFGGVAARNPSGDLARSLEIALMDALAQREKWPEWGEKNRRTYEGHYRVEAMMAMYDQLMLGSDLSQKPPQRNP